MGLRNVVRTGVKVLIADAVLLIAEFFAISDVQARLTCANGAALYGQGCLTRDSPGYSYSVLVQYLSMTSQGGLVLTSPPTLDWIQLLVVALIVINLWYIVKTFRSRRSTPDFPGKVPT